VVGFFPEACARNKSFPPQYRQKGKAMTNHVNQAAVFLPMLAIVALTLIAFLRMAVARAGAAKEKAGEPHYYRAFLGTPEPEYAVVAVRHYANLFELPLLFYTGCVSAFVLGTVSTWLLVWAWCYVVARASQSAVHLTYNNPAHRGLAFVVGWVFIVALWIDVAWAVVATL
jgi:hypothetical protein